MTLGHAQAREGFWAGVAAHAARLSGVTLSELFTHEPDRLAAFSLDACGLRFDWSKQRLDLAAKAALLQYADEVDLAGWRARLFAGEKVNATEGRAVQHTALRGVSAAKDETGKPLIEEVSAARARIAAFAATAHQRFSAIVHVGIGGSDLGPQLVWTALKRFRRPGVAIRFAANVDGAEIADALEGLDPKTTLVVVVSKTFTTQETMANAGAARQWLRDALGPKADDHLAAVTAAPAAAQAWGVGEAQIFPFWSWVGGRYSLWSAVSLSVECATESGVFERLLAGAAAMDRHFLEAPFAANAPVLAALVQMWNREALGATSYAVIPYARRLEKLAAFLQQLEMESNGKGVDRDGAPIPRPASVVTWGDVGANAQHSFFQQLHQGRDVVPVEFVIDMDAHEGPVAHRALIHANALAQAQALMVGKSREAAYAELKAQGMEDAQAAALAPHKTFSGNRPSTIIALQTIAPETLGALIAFYEHRTFVQGVLAGVNSFDQWGVELGKALANDVLAGLTGGAPKGALDPSTANWIARLKA
jgi:glucose-6-phosphate isomerase